MPDWMMFGLIIVAMVLVTKATGRDER